ncbi:hypothetical protein M3Y97_00342300 [Aphelenchoides bicaudatus]|nr:hypothetical protein M3Y97_00342300 [Aphelenchoides bicaudatus]
MSARPILAVIALVAAIFACCFKRQQGQGEATKDSKESSKQKEGSDSVKTARHAQSPSQFVASGPKSSKSSVFNTARVVSEKSKTAKSASVNTARSPAEPQVSGTSEPSKNVGTAKEDAMSEGETKDVTTAKEPSDEALGQKKAQTSVYLGIPMQQETNKSKYLGPSVEEQAAEDVLTALSPNGVGEPVMPKKKKSGKKKGSKGKSKGSSKGSSKKSGKKSN